MKQLIPILALLFSFSATHAQFDKLDISLWDATGSNFMETPSPQLASPQGNIWGDFDTYFLELDYQKPFLGFFAINIHARGGLIQPNHMFLYSETNYLTIGGNILGGNVNLMFCPFHKKNFQLAAYVGFAIIRADKEFYDYTSPAGIQAAGNFGYYKATMFGPEVGLIAKESFLKHLLGIELSLYGNPSYENENLVAGWSPEPQEDYGKGYRYGGSVFADVHISKLYVGLGYRYEKSYFNYSVTNLYDLAFQFSGIQIRAGIQMKK